MINKTEQEVDYSINQLIGRQDDLKLIPVVVSNMAGRIIATIMCIEDENDKTKLIAI